MNVTKTISTVGVGAAIVAGSMLAVSFASAHSGNRQSEVVDRLASELNVDSSAVQGVFDNMKEERKAEREAKHAEHIATLVSDGKLTQAQADELTALRSGFKAEIVALKESGAERDAIKAAMDENRAEVEAWADAQGLNLDDIKPERGESQGKRHHRGGGMNQEAEGADA